MAHFHQNTVLFPTEVESIYFKTKKFSYRVETTKSCLNIDRMCHYLGHFTTNCDWFGDVFYWRRRLPMHFEYYVCKTILCANIFVKLNIGKRAVSLTLIFVFLLTLTAFKHYLFRNLENGMKSLKGLSFDQY